MADTRVQREVEGWIRVNWMPLRFAQPFTKRPVKLTDGGVFEPDVVNADGSIVGCISTSGATTSGGNRADGKIKKIHSDMQFLRDVKGAARRLLIFTEEDMFELFTRDQHRGRIPAIFELVLAADIPNEMRARLVIARIAASKEMTPSSP